MENVILQPIEVGGQTFKNRIMFPPLTTGYEKNGMISEQDMGFYTRLAKGGVGYIVMGDVAPINSFSPTPKLFDDSQIPAFKALADSVHAYGTKLGVQLFHPEYDVDAINSLFMQKKFDEMRQRLHHVVMQALTHLVKLFLHEQAVDGVHIVLRVEELDAQLCAVGVYAVSQCLEGRDLAVIKQLGGGRKAVDGCHIAHNDVAHAALCQTGVEAHVLLARSCRFSRSRWSAGGT